MKNIAILASGSGTNAENIAKFFAAGSRYRVALTLTNRKNAGVIQRMESLGVPVEYFPNSVWDEEPQTIVETLRRHDISLVVLAGFMHYVSPLILEAYPEAVINIHPSLLPSYGGKGMWGHHVHQAVIAAEEKESGVTVHYVTDEFDKGEIVMQEKVKIDPDDTPETLEAKIHQVEYSLYPRAIVKAFERLNGVPPLPGNTATPVNPDMEWAEVLKMNYDPNLITPPPVPQSEEKESQPQQPATPQYSWQRNWSQQPGQNTRKLPDEPMPPTYMIWAVLSTLCCCFIPGILAIIYSAQVSSKYYAGDLEGAKKASERAQIWIIVAFSIGVVFSAISLPLSLIGN